MGSSQDQLQALETELANLKSQLEVSIVWELVFDVELLFLSLLLLDKIFSKSHYWGSKSNSDTQKCKLN